MFFDLISADSVSALGWTFLGACAAVGLAIAGGAYAVNAYNRRIRALYN